MIIKSCFPNGFKIRSYKTLQLAIVQYITRNQEHIIKLNPHKAMFLTIRDNYYVELSFKTGDLYDMWNPTLRVPDDLVTQTLWNYRKQLNEYFFPND